MAWICEPAALVFPRITRAGASRLEPIPAHEALMELLPNVLLTEPRACQAHLDALAQVTSVIPCYRLWTGDDFDELPALLGDLIA